MFILTISCLTVSNFPWFIDLIFQVPMQYCSLQHQILFSSPDTSTTEYPFRFGPAASFFLGLLVVLPSSPVVYQTPSNLGDSSLIVIHFCLLIQFMRFSWQVYWGVCRSLLQWITFCQNSPQWPIRLGWPYTAWLIASRQAPLPQQVLRLTLNEALMPEPPWQLYKSHEKTQRSGHAGIKTKLVKKKKTKKKTQVYISKRKVFIRQ